MAGQIAVNEKITKIKAKQSELTANAAAGKAQLASATSKVTELKTQMTDLIPDIPEVPSIQGELSKLGSLTQGGLLSKISGLVTQYGSAIPGLSSLLGTMGLSSYPPTISVDSIRDEIPNVEEVDGAMVTQPQEPEVPEEPPAPPIKKEVIEIDYKGISLSLFKKEYSIQYEAMLDALDAEIEAGLSTSTEGRGIKYIYKHTWYTSFAEQVGVSLLVMKEFINVTDTAKAEQHTALYTVADSNRLFKGVKTGYIKVKGEHKESDKLLDFAEVCNYWWEKKQKNT